MSDEKPSSIDAQLKSEGFRQITTFSNTNIHHALEHIDGLEEDNYRIIPVQFAHQGDPHYVTQPDDAIRHVIYIKDAPEEPSKRSPRCGFWDF